MAIEFKKLNDKLEKAPLSPEELSMIDKVEAYIDKEIEKQFKGGDVSIQLSIADFNYDISVKQTTNLPEARKILMRKELVKRYKNAGWKQWVEFDDGLDGPNRSGPDYWKLSGKGK